MQVCAAPVRQQIAMSDLGGRPARLRYREERGQADALMKHRRRALFGLRHRRNQYLRGPPSASWTVREMHDE